MAKATRNTQNTDEQCLQKYAQTISVTNWAAARAWLLLFLDFNIAEKYQSIAKKLFCGDNVMGTLRIQTDCQRVVYLNGKLYKKSIFYHGFDKKV